MHAFLFIHTFPFLTDDLVFIAEVDSPFFGPASPFGFIASLSQVIPSSSMLLGFRQIVFTIGFASDPTSGSQVTLTPTDSPAVLDSSSPQRYILVSYTSLVLYPFGLFTLRLKRSCSGRSSRLSNFPSFFRRHGVPDFTVRVVNFIEESFGSETPLPWR